MFDLATIFALALGLHPAPAAPAAPATTATQNGQHLASMVLFETPAAAQAAAPATAAEALGRVQTFYAGIKQVTAIFKQEVTNNTFGSTKSSDGTVWIEKPGKMRWDYVEKRKADTVVKKSFISNGQTLYLVEHDNKQVVKKSLSQDLMPVAVSFLYGKGDLKAEFNPALDTSGKWGVKGDVVLKLTPKTPSAQYKALVLVADPNDGHVKESVIIDSSDNVNHFRFFGPDFEKPIKDSWFEFDERSVKNYRVVDADQQQQGSGAIPAPTP